MLTTTLITEPCYFYKEGEPCETTCYRCRGAQVQTYHYTACGIEGCTYNAYGMSPRHEATDRCKSGKKAHCTCGTCY